MSDKCFKLVVRNKKLLRNPKVRKWIKETEDYINFKLEREIEYLLTAEVHQKVREMMHKQRKS
jgi:hypothetical protein